MKRTLMITAAVGALIAGMNIAAAQMNQQQQQPAASGSGGAQLEQKGQAQQKADPKGQADTKGQAQKADTKGQAETKGQAGADTKAQGQAQGQRDQGQARDQQRGGDMKAGDSKAQGDNKAAQGGGGGGAKSLSAEQKTKVRETVIKSGPRVTNVNFSLNVGTVVPRTVTFAPLPPVLVEIYPQWRSYRYFIVEEKIVIIDDNFKIVTIIVV